MIKKTNIRDLIFILLCTYYAQGSFYAQGSGISQVIFVSVLGLSGLFFLKTLLRKDKKPLFYKVWTILFILNVVGFGLTGEITNPLHFSMLKGILFTFLVFYPFYHFSNQNLLNQKHLVRFVITILPFFILQFYLNSEQILSDRISDKTEIVNNSAYLFVGLIPYVFLINRKKTIAFVLISLLMFFIIQSAKRGALISGGIGLIIFVFFQVKNIEKKNRTKGFLFVITTLFALCFYAYDLYEKNQYLVLRMRSIAEGSLSGRDTIYTNLFNSWIQSDSFINIFFGFGYAASLNLSGTGNFAHNDWLELLSNFGLTGITIFALLFASAFQNFKKWNFNTRIILMVLLLILAINTVVYRFYSAGDGFLYSIILGFLFGGNRISANSQFAAEESSEENLKNYSIKNSKE